MHQIRYFLAVTETLNFTRAAEKCNVAQPSLTRAIKNLEDELGGPLFNRERNRTNLTELGRTMMPYLHQVYDQAEAAKHRALDFVKLRDAPLTIGIMCTIGPTRLIGLFDGFQRTHDGVELHLRDARGALIQDMLLEGEIDLGIYGLPEGIDERLHALRLFDERFVIAVAPGHRFEAQDAVSGQDLNGERYLNRVNCEVAPYARQAFEERGVQVVRPYRSERDDWIQAMILAGLGFGFFPEFAVTMPGIVARPLVDPEVIRTIHLVTVRGRPHSPAVGAFVRAAKGYRWDRAGVPPLAGAS